MGRAHVQCPQLLKKRCMSQGTSTPEERGAPNHAYVCVCVLRSLGDYSHGK